MTSLDLLDKDGVRLTVDDAVATVTLANPAKRNAQSPALWRALAEAGRVLPGSVRVVVLRGEGKSFSAGLDRQAFTPEGFDGEPSFLDLARGPDEELDATIAEYQEAFTWWRRNDLVSASPPCRGTPSAPASSSPSPAICGSCAEDVQFAMRETSLGLVPDLTGTHPLVEPAWATPARWRSAPPAASCTPRRPSAPASPTSSSPPTELDARRRRPGRGPARRPARRRRRDQGAARPVPSRARTRSSAPPSGPPRAAGCATWRALAD